MLEIGDGVSRVHCQYLLQNYNTVKNKTLRLSITLYLSVWTLRNRDKPLESEFDSVVEVHTLRDKVKTFLYRDSSLMNRDISLNLLRC